MCRIVRQITCYARLNILLSSYINWPFIPFQRNSFLVFQLIIDYYNWTIKNMEQMLLSTILITVQLKCELSFLRFSTNIWFVNTLDKFIMAMLLGIPVTIFVKFLQYFHAWHILFFYWFHISCYLDENEKHK